MNLLTKEETIYLRRHYIAESCELHLSKDPLKIIRSQGQYLYDDENNEYLDFVSRTTNVGHCNDEVLNAARSQIMRLNMPVGEETTQMQTEYIYEIISTLPANFDVMLFTNSGSEANDLALQMVRKCTGHEDIIVVDGSYHGSGNLLADISPRTFKISPEGKKPWVHVIPVPDTFRGPYRTHDASSAERYFQDAKAVISGILANNRKIGGFISEPVFVGHGVLIPPPGWLNKIYRYIKELGGIIIADEIQCGMGRTGNTFWGFQSQDATPDIITVGKPMGNGHPVGAVITSKRIAKYIRKTEDIYRCEPAAVMVGMAVLKVMQEQKLVEKSMFMGEILKGGLESLKAYYAVIGDVRGIGSIVGVDIVEGRGCTKPAPKIAEEICLRLKNEKILVDCEGEYKNVLLFLPPMCINENDCLLVVHSMHKVLADMELSKAPVLVSLLKEPVPVERESSELHFDKDPLKIIRSHGQYLYDDENNEYLDFVSRITNVGHCNEEVVKAAYNQMTRLNVPVGEEVTEMQEQYKKELLDTLPDNFQVVLFTNSGAEANDLALQMARKYTGNQDIIVVDGAFHGTGNLLADISPRAFKISPEGKKPWVHVIPVPDTFRGAYRKHDASSAESYFQDAKVIFSRILANDRKIGAFISETVFVVHGVLIPPPGWLSKIYGYIRKLGGIIIADEIQCGMGRTGNTLWGFQSQDAIPDIITVGKPMGNGHPIGAVITSKQIAGSIVNSEQIYQCEPVGAVIGLTVLKVMQEQRLVGNAKVMGEMLKEGLETLKPTYGVIGDVRGIGLIVGVDIVQSRDSTIPAPEIAEEICNRLKDEKILVASEGEYKNVLIFLPALCINENDCLLVVHTLRRVLSDIELAHCPELFGMLKEPSSVYSSNSGSSPERPMTVKQEREVGSPSGPVYEGLD